MTSNCICSQSASSQSYCVQKLTTDSVIHNFDLNYVFQSVFCQWSMISVTIDDAWNIIKKSEKLTETHLKTEKSTLTSLNCECSHNAVNNLNSSSWKEIDLEAVTWAVDAQTIS